MFQRQDVQVEAQHNCGTEVPGRAPVRFAPHCCFKPFRCNTYEKRGGGGQLSLTRFPMPSRRGDVWTFRSELHCNCGAEIPTPVGTFFLVWRLRAPTYCSYTAWTLLCLFACQYCPKEHTGAAGYQQIWSRLPGSL